MTTSVVHVIGGGAGIGRWFIRKAFADMAQVYCYDINQSSLVGLGANVISCHVDTAGYSRYAANFGRNDWVLYAAAPQHIEHVMSAVLPFLKEGTLIVSMTSVQEKSSAVLKSMTPSSCVHLGCHPLFGPTVSSPVGQLAALIDFTDRNSQHKKFREYLSSKGIIATELSARDHDRHMAIIQALTHFSLFAFARSILEIGVHPSDLLKLKTPNFQFLYAFASRVLKISPGTTGAIQATADASELRSTFIRTATALHESFEQDRTESGCSQVVFTLREPLTGAEVDEGAEIAAVAVDSIQRFEALIHKHCVTGAPFVFRHRTTNTLHVVRIVEIRAEEIRCEESTKAIGKGKDNRLAIGLNTIARENYKTVGINLPLPKAYVTKKRNIKLMDADEFKEFYKNTIYPMTVVRNFLNEHAKTETYFEEWLPKLVKGLWSCECLEMYKKRGQNPRATLRLMFNPNTSRTEILERVRSLVEENTLLAATNGAL